MQNPWRNMPISEPYVLAEDEQIIRDYNHAPRDKGKGEQEIHLEVFPEPYCGNPQASLILLNLNLAIIQELKCSGKERLTSVKCGAQT
jgi:hypothetical protein